MKDFTVKASIMIPTEAEQKSFLAHVLDVGLSNIDRQYVKERWPTVISTTVKLEVM